LGFRNYRIKIKMRTIMKTIILIIVSFITLNAQTRIIPFSTKPGGGGGAPAGSIPDYVSSSDSISTSWIAGNDSLNVGYPTVVNADDILMMEVMIQNSSTTSAANIQTPSGWTLASQDSARDSYSLTTALFWKRAVGTEDGTSILVYATASHFNAPDIKAVMHRFDSTITSGTPYEDLTVDNNLASAAANDTAFTSLITITGTNRLAVCIIAIEDNGVATPMVNYTEVYDANRSTGRDMQFVVEVLDKPTSGDVAVDYAPLSIGADRHVTYTFALKPIP
jgi:hypothetical protein